MSKIKTISIQNFKAITDFTADFKGATAIITGGNNKGKSSFLRGIPDRIRFVRPEVMVKDGEKKGRGEMTLDSGEKFVWDFSIDGVDKLTYITDKGRTSVTKELGSQFFPPLFDIDKFMQSSPKQQVKQLQAIVGIDFTEIHERHEKAYSERTERNREAELYRVKLEKMIKCDMVKPVDLEVLKAKKKAEQDRLNGLYKENKAANDKARGEWNEAKSKIDKEVSKHNIEQVSKRVSYNACFDALSILKNNGYAGDEVHLFLKEIEDEIRPEKTASKLYPKEPTYIEEMPDRTNLDKIDAELLEASETNAAAQKYKEYIDHVSLTDGAKEIAEEANQVVIAIENERKQMIESASFPKGISINSEGILVDGLPLDKNQISTSKLYCAALRIASMNLGEVKTLYFDASFLDRNTLAEIQEWANEHDLQLLIERPDFEGGEISYQLIENHG